MNARFGFPSPAAAMVALGCLVSPASGGSLVNGGFESGFDGWTWGGNVAVESPPFYAPAEGSKLIAFNSGDTTPNGWVSQEVEIPYNPGFHTLRFDVGNLGFISAEVRLRVEITEIGYGASVPRVNEVITVPGITGGATRWLQACYDFPNPFKQVLVKLTDESPETNGTDLVVDNLRIEDSVKLSVSTSEASFPVLAVSIAPASMEGWTTGNTPVTFNYHKGGSLVLTAPAFANGKPFLLWRRNGVDCGNDPVIGVTLDEEYISMVAIYDPPLELHLNNPAEARGFVGTGPFDHLSWSGSISNRTGASEDWTASAAVPVGSPDPVFFKVFPSHGNSASLRICLTAEALKLPAGTHYGRIDVSSRFGTAETGIVLTVIDPDQYVENGSFESGLDGGWSALDHTTLESAPPYTAADGSKLIVFNASDATPNGTLVRTIPTEADVAYTLTYDVGTLSFNTNEQRLEVAIANAGDPPFHVQTEILSGAGDGTCHWQSRQTSFIAHGAFTTLTFRDVSPTTNAIDLLLDHVRVANPGFDLTVTTLADENDATPGTGTGDSLREAIAWANTSPGTNAIRFAPALNQGMITLIGSQLSTTLPLAIDASALPSGITVNAGGESRVLELGAAATLQNLRIENGNCAGSSGDQYGGGISNHDKLMLSGVSLSDNTSPFAAGGIHNSGDLSAFNCRFTGNHAIYGGALLNWGQSNTTTLLENSLVSGNSAVNHGGGLACLGPYGYSWIILSGSTVSDNTAGGYGGGYSGLFGYKSWGTLVGENSTFCGNSSVSSGGAIHGDVLVDLTHCTVSANSSATEGGGIASAEGSIRNCIVAGNSAPAYPELWSNNFHPEANNLLEGNPQLAPLTDYGGPTPTMPPLPGSPAIHGGLPIPGTPATDQRGCARTSGTAPDLGAVEMQEMTVNTLVDENDGPLTGAISLRDAITTTLPTPPDLIRFHPSLNGGTITLAHGELVLDSSRMIDASSLSAGLTVSAGHASRIMTVSNHAGVAIDGLTFADGFSTEDGGGLKVGDEADVTMSHCTIRDNESTASGGGIHLGEGYLSLDHSRVTDNHATGDGGGIHTLWFTGTRLLDSWIDQNTCGSSGGGIYNRGGLDLVRATISNNHCPAAGGGIAIVPMEPFFGKISIETSTLTGNSSGNGGAIAFPRDLLIHNSTITGNTAANTGGGIFLTDGSTGGSLSLANSILTGNQAPTAPDTSIAPAELLGNNLLTGNPALAPLGDYGGPTPTMPPLPGSPVINAAVMLPDTPATDQRGCPRPFGPLPDIGAVEATPFCQMEPVDTDNDGIDDRLEPAYQMTVGNDDSGRDSDGDGSSDAEELANMTDPYDSNSLLRIISFEKAPEFDAIANPVFDVSFASFPGLSYAIECNQNLDFSSPDTRTHPFGKAADFTGSTRITLAADRDFVRVRREP